MTGDPASCCMGWKRRARTGTVFGSNQYTLICVHAFLVEVNHHRWQKQCLDLSWNSFGFVPPIKNEGEREFGETLRLSWSSLALWQSQRAGMIFLNS